MSTTHKPWPEEAEPTPEQFADWLAICTPEERLHVATVTLRNGSKAAACLIRDHEGEIEFLRAEHQRLGRDLDNALRGAEVAS